MSSEHEAVMEASSATISTITCSHHWVIDTPAGPLSKGRCKLCGLDREFRNSPDNAFYWEDDASRKAAAAAASGVSTSAVAASRASGTDE
ncbi:MAG: hypothetical protein IIC27_00035 [Chloroflexi bacterium]|nr:hypothetical protein [Chloroflexota bacterium]